MTSLHCIIATHVRFAYSLLPPPYAVFRFRWMQASSGKTRATARKLQTSL